MQLFVEITIPLFSRDGVLLVLTELTVLIVGKLNVKPGSHMSPTSATTIVYGYS